MVTLTDQSYQKIINEFIMVSRNLCDHFLVSTKYKIGTCTHLLKRVTKVKKVKSCVRLGQDGGDECKLKQITGIIIKKKTTQTSS